MKCNDLICWLDKTPEIYWPDVIIAVLVGLIVGLIIGRLIR